MSPSRTAAHKQRIIALGSERRWPTIYGLSDLVLEGDLISYRPDLHENFCRGANYMDSILKGARQRLARVSAE
jgi:hypothetical protein